MFLSTHKHEDQREVPGSSVHVVVQSLYRSVKHPWNPTFACTHLGRSSRTPQRSKRERLHQLQAVPRECPAAPVRADTSKCPAVGTIEEISEPQRNLSPPVISMDRQPEPRTQRAGRRRHDVWEIRCPKTLPGRPDITRSVDDETRWYQMPPQSGHMTTESSETTKHGKPNPCT